MAWRRKTPRAAQRGPDASRLGARQIDLRSSAGSAGQPLFPGAGSRGPSRPPPVRLAGVATGAHAAGVRLGISLIVLPVPDNRGDDHKRRAGGDELPGIAPAVACHVVPPSLPGTRAPALVVVAGAARSGGNPHAKGGEVGGSRATSDLYDAFRPSPSRSRPAWGKIYTGEV